MRQIINGFHGFFEQGIVHSNLKMQNIFVHLDNKILFDEDYEK